MNLSFSSYDELRCLHLALCEAKFNSSPERKEIQGSPFVAETANKVFDLLINEAPTKIKSDSWLTHRNLKPNYTIFPIIQKRCIEKFNSENWEKPAKLEFIANMTAPYIASPAIIDQLLTL